MVRQGAKDSDGLACGRMKQRWIDLFWWHPHQASRAMLLEMTFVFKPQVNAWISRHATEFFYMHAALQDQRAQSQTEVSFCGIPIS